MPSWAARSPVAAEVRADRNPTVSPARCAQMIPVPSLMSNCLLSVPSALRRILPSVSTPSTSNRIRRIFTALADNVMGSNLEPERTLNAEPGTLNASLKHLQAPQIVDVHDAGESSRPTGVRHHDRRDLPLFHDIERFGRERVGRDRDRVP